MSLFDFPSWLRQAFPRSNRAAKRAVRARRTSLRLETLEDRVVPATILGRDYAGANLTPGNGDILQGTFTNVGTFEVALGTTVYVEPGTPLSVSANAIHIDGVLDGDGAGFAGGPNGMSGSPGSGPGGGQGGDYGAQLHASGGGGGGYGGAGGKGAWLNAGPTQAQGGVTYDGTGVQMGSGGGGAGDHDNAGGFPGTGGPGGVGGGAISLAANQIFVTGTITDNGANGQQGVADSYSVSGGGGGSGGGIELDGGALYLSGTLAANGGTGADFAGPSGGYGHGGGSGGGGRIKLTGSEVGSFSESVTGGGAGQSDVNTTDQATAGDAGSFVGATAVPPTSFTITSSSDDPNDVHSLRYAIDNAVANETIDFDPSVRTITLSNSYKNTTGLVIAADGLNIVNDQGVGPVTIDGGNLFTVFTVNFRATATLSGLTIQHGYTSNTIGGGGVLNAGNLTLINDTLSGDTAQGGDGNGAGAAGGGGGGGGLGGGVYNSGTLTVQASTFTDDQAVGGGGGAGGTNGGGGGGGGGGNNGYYTGGNGRGPYGGAGAPGGGSTPGGDGGYASGGGGATYSSGAGMGGFGGGGGGGEGGAGGSGGLGGGAGGSGSFSGGGGGAGLGGGVFNASGGVVAITNTTFYRNAAQGGEGGDSEYYNGSGGNGSGGSGFGAAVFSAGGTVTITSSTIAGNTASGGPRGVGGQGATAGMGTAGGVYVYGGAATVDSTIIATNSVGGPGTNSDFDVAGAFTDSGYNLIETVGDSTGFTQSTDITGKDPQLSSPASNGGPTQTMALGAASPALDKGDPYNGVTVDQRGVPRPQSSAPSIGAFEPALLFLSGGVTISPVEGIDPGLQTVASFPVPRNNDTNFNDYSATIDWGDGHQTGGSFALSMDGKTIYVQGDNTYNEEGTFAISVSVTDKNSPANTPASTATSAATVADAPLSATAVAVNAAEGQAVTNVPTATFTDADPHAVIGDYNVTVAWGDGETSVGTVTAVQGGFQVTASKPHPYAEEGPRTVTVSIFDVDGGSTATESWSSAAPLPTATGGLRVVEGADGRLYALGGYNGGYSNSVYAYDPATNNPTWTPVANMVTARLNFGAILGPDGRIYVIGGGNASGNLQSVEAFTPFTDQWTQVAPLPVALVDVAAATGTDGRIYAIGGYTSSGAYSSAVYAYTPSTNSWVQITASLPAGVSALAAVAGADGKIYAIGGYTNSKTGFSNAVYTYTPGASSWVQLPASLPTARNYLAAVVGLDGAIYAIGGDDATLGNSTNTIYAYTPGVSSSWSQLPATLSLGRADFGAAVGADGRVYAVGGYYDANQDATASVEALGVPRATATTTSNITVTDQPVTAQAGPAINATPGDSTGVVLLASFTDPAGAEAFADYSATVDWGDGTAQTPDNESTTTANSNVFIVQSGNRFFVEGTHTYATASPSGGYMVQTTIHHDTATDAVVTLKAAVASANGSGGSAAGQFFQFSAPTYTVNEVTGGTTKTITVTRTGGTTGPVAVGYTTFDGTATAGTDYTTATGTLNFADGDMSKTFSVPVLDDGDTGEGDETVYLALTSASNGAGLAGPSLATLTIHETAVGQSFQFGSPTYTVNEAGGTQATITVTRSNGSDGTATVDYATSDGTATAGTDYTATSGTLTFAPGVTSQTFTVPILDDGTALTLEHAGTVTLTLSNATNGANINGQSTATLTIDETNLSTPVVTSLNDVEGAATGAITGLATFSDLSGVGSSTDAFTATINWGDGTTPLATGTVVALGNGAYRVDAPTHTFADDGPYTVRVHITHDGIAYSGSAQAMVSDPAVSATGGFTYSTTEGVISPPVGTVATFTDPAGAESDAADYTATINWGDGSTPTAGNGTVTLDHGVFTVSGGYRYAEEGKYTVSVQIHHGTAPDVTVISTAIVADATVSVADNSGTLPQTGVEGTSIGPVGNIATITDNHPGSYYSEAADFNAVILWGDGTTSQGAVSNASSGGVVTWRVDAPAHTYAEDGQYTVQVQVSHDQAATVTSTGQTITIGDVAVNTPVVTTLNATENVATAANLVVATFGDPAGAGGVEPASDFSATIAWGDNTTTDASTGKSPTVQVVALGGGQYQVVSTAGHTYADDGTDTITVVVTHGGLTSTGTGTAVVADRQITGLTLTAPSGGSEGAGIGAKSQAVATFIDPAGANTANDVFTASVVWGDGTTSAGTVTPAGGPGHYNVTVASDHTYSEEGQYLLSVTVQHGALPPVVVSQTVAISDPAVQTVTDAGTLPSGVVEGQSTGPITDIAEFTDPGGQGREKASDFTATINWGDGTVQNPDVVSATVVALNGGNYQVNAPGHVYAQDGQYNVSVSVSHDGTAAATSHGRQITIAEAPAGTPVVAMVNAVEQTPTGAITGLATFSDAAGTSGDTFTATINWGTGAIDTHTSVVSLGNGQYRVDTTVGHNYAEEGDYPVTVIISVGGAADAVGSGAATVSDPSVVGHGATLTAAEGAAFTGKTVATFTDPAGAENDLPADYTATIDWGDGSTVTANNGTVTLSNGVFTVAGDHTYAEEGVYTVNVTLHHASSADVTVTDTALVSDPRPTGLSVANLPMGQAEGAQVSPITGIATFTDPGGAGATGEPSDFTATVSWGDGRTTAATVATTGTAGVYQVNDPTGHTYAEEGTYTVTVSVQHEQLAPVSATGSITIRDAALLVTAAPPTAMEGVSTGVIQVATFTDADPAGTASDYHATIHWGDIAGSGTDTAGAIVDLGNHTFGVTGSHTYAEDGPQTDAFSVMVTDAGTATNTGTGTVVTVADSPLTITQFTPPTGAVEGTPTGTLTLATFTDAGAAEDVSASIAWGDGTSGGTIVDNHDGSFSVTGSHTYAEEGTGLTFSVTLTDASGKTASRTGTVNVADAALSANGGFAFVAAEGQAPATAQTVATFTDLANPIGALESGDYSATIDWGDGAAATAGAITHSGGTFTVKDKLDHQYSEEGTYQIHVTIHHDAAPDVTVVSTATVSDPVVTTVTDKTAPTAGVEGQPIAATDDIAEFTDPGGQGKENVGDFTAMILWGDNTNSYGTLVSLGNGVYQVNAPSHTYAEENTAGYNVQVRVAHDGTAAATSIGQSVVVADQQVSNPAVAPLGAVEGQPTTTNLVVATFSDPAGTGTETQADFTVTINWGDSATNDTATSVASLGNGQYQVVSTNGHTYAEDGPYTITVSVTHGALTAVSGVGAATVSDPQLTGLAVVSASLPTAATEGTAIAPISNLARFTDPAAAMTTDATGTGEFTATVNWGDGQSTAAKVVATTTAGLYQVNDPTGHVFADEGAYAVSVTVRHNGLAPLTSAGQSLSVNVLPSYAVAVFPGHGLYRYADTSPMGTGGSWVQLSQEEAAPAAVGADGEVAAELASGVSTYTDGSGWQSTSKGGATALAVDDVGDVFAVISGDVWRYNTSAGWVETHLGNDVSGLAAYGAGNAFAIHAGDAWLFTANAGWVETHLGNDVSGLAADALGDGFAVHHGDVWRYLPGVGWQETHLGNDVGALVAGGLGNAFAVHAGDVWSFTAAAGWRPTNGGAATLFASDNCDGAFGEFLGAGFYRYGPNTGWQQQTMGNVVSLPVMDAQGDLFAEVSGKGVYRYTEAAGWQSLNSGDATLLRADGAGDVFALYSGDVYRYTPATGWLKTGLGDAAALEVDGAGDAFAVYAGDVWLFTANAGWQETHLGNDVSGLAVDNAGDAYAVHAGNVWRYAAGGGWNNGKTNLGAASQLTADGAGDAYAVHNGDVWRYTPGGGWAPINGGAATSLAADNAGGVLGVFPAGVYRYTASAGWQPVTTGASRVSADAEGDVFVEFPNQGFYRYLNGAGLLLLEGTEGDPSLLA